MRAYASALSNKLAFRSLCWQWEKGEELVLFWSANIVEALAITVSAGLSVLAVFLRGGAVIAHFKLSKSRQREWWLVTSYTNSSGGGVWCQSNLSAEPSVRREGDSEIPSSHQHRHLPTGVCGWQTWEMDKSPALQTTAPPPPPHKTTLIASQQVGLD